MQVCVDQSANQRTAQLKLLIVIFQFLPFSVLNWNSTNRSVQFDVFSDCYVLPQCVMLWTIAEHFERITLTVSDVVTADLHLAL